MSRWRTNRELLGKVLGERRPTEVEWVNQAESDQIAAALEAKKVPVTYVLFPDEGHGFARPENRIAFFAVSEAFLSRCAGGRGSTCVTT